ncbi:hypothetical protein BDA99DRAFT_606274 [Phascolomyces articulosus]|uniref:Uncharacterized protein n=1 Tax=Phascolomyces articulosus TaxID=60185 RepID=A0AAD5K6Q0_9FUNG|nr:hypothetical protein BDA99DRAFT_606274 [Phascolomyces articulosus]
MQFSLLLSVIAITLFSVPAAVFVNCQPGDQLLPGEDPFKSALDKGANVGAPNDPKHTSYTPARDE